MGAATRRQLGRILLLLFAAVVAQGIGHAFDAEPMMTASLVATLVLIALASFVLGGLFQRSWFLAALIAGAVFAAVLWLLNWEFLKWLRVDVLRHDDAGSILHSGGPYVLWLPIAALPAATMAAIGAWRNKLRHSSTAPNEGGDADPGA